MIATKNSIAGEVFRLQRNFSVPMTEKIHEAIQQQAVCGEGR